jgi:hypothetical protein
LEVLEVLEGSMPGSAEAGQAALDEDEVGCHLVIAVGQGDGFVEVVGEPLAAAFDGAIPELRFEGGGAAEEPVAADQLEDESGFEAALRVAGLEVVFLEGDEFVFVLFANDDVLGVEAVADGVLEEAALPAAVRGPVERCELRRFASVWAWVATGEGIARRFGAVPGVAGKWLRIFRK